VFFLSHVTANPLLLRLCTFALSNNQQFTTNTPPPPEDVVVVVEVVVLPLLLLAWHFPFPDFREKERNGKVMSIQ